MKAINLMELNATTKWVMRKNIILLGSLVTTTQTINAGHTLAAEEH